ncbi:MAG: UDP-N-acetylenolpyruvoylglucosamine reductase [Planctomycetota bacterium]|nr:MAG: UDP-N-acetylenolpyruvoylglucosamine reductase [Planctomycetota bacterium]
MNFTQDPPIEFKKNFITASLTTFDIGGPADIVAWPKNSQELISIIQWANKNNLKNTFLGGGSNVLISDKGIRDLLIVTSGMNEIKILQDDLYEFGAGCDVQELTQWAIKNNLSGLEFAGGLPGSLGGAVWMNARAYGSEFSKIVTWAEAVNQNNEVEFFNNDEMNFVYKHSVFQERPLRLTKVRMKLLTLDDNTSINNKTQSNIDDRDSKDQYHIKSAGCVFKNNYAAGIPSGKLIEDAGLKGYQIGGAEIYAKHANFVVNKNNAKASDVIALMQLAKKAVQDKFNITIEPEVQFIGDFDEFSI